MAFLKLRKDTMERPYIFGEGDTLFRYNFATKYTKNKKVLDIGAGYGDGSSYILSKGAKEVIGIDYSQMAINEARGKFSKKGLDFQEMDALKLKFSNGSFDVVIAYEIIEHLPIEKYKKFLGNINNVLKKNGIALISTPNKLVYSPNRKKPHNPYHINEFTALELETLLKFFFPHVTVLGIRTINKAYIDQYNKMGKEFRYKILSLIGRSRFVRDVAGFIPKNLRMKITGENTMPRLTLKDFRTYQDIKERDQCLTLVAIVKK